MGNLKTRKMMQGALIAAMFGMFSLLNTYTGSMFDIFFGYAMIIGLVWYGYRSDFKYIVLTAIASMVVVALVGTPYFIIVSFTSCLNGIVVSELLKRNKSLMMIMLTVMAVCFLNNILIYEVFGGLLGMDLVTEMSEGYNMLVTQYPEIGEQFPLDYILSLIPAVMVMISALEMYVIIMLLSLGSMKLKYSFPKGVHIVHLRMKRKTGYLLAAMMFLGYGLTFIEGIDPMIGQYLYLIGTISYVVQGVATISFMSIVFEKKWLMPLGIITAFIGGLNEIHVILGLVDIFSDLREKLLYNKG